MQEIDDVIVVWFVLCMIDEVFVVFNVVDVLVGCIYSVVDMFIDLQFVVCQMIQCFKLVDGIDILLLNIMLKLLDMLGEMCWFGFEFGEYIDEVLCGFGYDVQVIVVLCEVGVI